MTQPEVIGIVPMAGRATRISPLPCSKELYPVALRESDAGARPKVASHYLLERLRLACVRKTLIVLREGKWDIPAYYKDGIALLDMHLGYVMAHVPHGAPFSLDSAYPFAKDAIVATGFPDILFSPDDAFAHLLAKLSAASADAVLGLFPWDQPSTDDMVDDGPDGRVRAIHLKENVPHLRYCWVMAVWSPRFTRFMHNYLGERLASGEAAQRELTVGHVLKAAVEAGLDVRGVRFPDGRFLDIGTPSGLRQVAEFASDQS